MSRTYKTKGKEWFGVELARNGDSITLRVHEGAWPFPSEKTFDRSELVWICGDPEPARETEESKQ